MLQICKGANLVFPPRPPAIFTRPAQEEKSDIEQVRDGPLLSVAIMYIVPEILEGGYMDGAGVVRGGVGVGVVVERPPQSKIDSSQAV